MSLSFKILLLLVPHLNMSAGSADVSWWLCNFNIFLIHLKFITFPEFHFLISLQASSCHSVYLTSDHHLTRTRRPSHCSSSQRTTIHHPSHPSPSTPSTIISMFLFPSLPSIVISASSINHHHHTLPPQSPPSSSSPPPHPPPSYLDNLCFKSKAKTSILNPNFPLQNSEYNPLNSY